MSRQDDHWDNYWRNGANTRAGLGSARCRAAGSGAKSMGTGAGAAATQFARCQVEKVFKTVCLHATGERARTARKVNDIIGVFKSGGYKLKDVFAETAAYCKGN